MPDYTELIAEFWPTIELVWNEHCGKQPIIECDVVRGKVAAMPAREYIEGLTARSREATHRQYKEVSAEGGMIVFIRDSKNRVLRSHVFMPSEK